MRKFLETVLYNPWVEWEPNPFTGERGPSEKQTDFLMSQIEEVLYGGAIRGGKSWALLAAAVMYYMIPNYSAILFRKNTTDLELTDGLLDLAERWGWEEKGAHFHGGKLRYTFPSGATISFGYIGPEGKKGWLRYKSSWYQFIGFDQVEELPLKAYLYLHSRAGRLASQDVPVRVWSSANPDGYEWVYERFVKPETRDPTSLFIPATADDNPWVDLEALERRLSRLDPVTFQQLRKGVWGLSTAGGMFDPLNFNTVKEVPFGEPLIGTRYWDLAATSEMEGGSPAWSVGVRMFRSLANNQIYVDNVARGRWSPLEVESQLKYYAALDRTLVTELQLRRMDTWIEEEPGGSGKAIMDYYLRGPLAGYPAFGDKVTGPKEERARPWAAAVARRFVNLVTGSGEGSALWMEPFRNEHRRFPGGQYKDQVDAASGAYNQLFGVSRAPAYA